MCKSLIRIFLSVLCILIPTWGSERLTPMDDMVDQAMTAYNAQDSQAFYRDFASSMSSIATPEAFSALYVNVYMAQFGAYESRTLIPEQTVIIESSPVALAVYKAKFLQAVVQLSVNFIKENDAWKIMQVQMQRLE